MPTPQDQLPRDSALRAPHSLALRANPFPEVTDLFCRLPLSTLFYRLEAAHLGDLMRLSVRPGVRVGLGRGFSRTLRRAPDMTKEPCYSGRLALSPSKSIPEQQTVNQQRERWLDLRRVSPHFR